MLSNSKLVAFAATSNPDSAKTFYQDTLGLTPVSRDPFALVFDSNGDTLRVSIVPQVTPSKYTILGWEVSDVQSSVAQLSGEHGIRFERFPGLPQDDAGIWNTPDGGKVAWFRDPDGNLLSLSQSKSE